MICRLTIPVREARPSSVAITVTIPLAVTVASELGHPYPDLPVYVFDGPTYTGFNQTTDGSGQVVFTLPAGDYRFRADLNGVQFWSGETDHCQIPGCENTSVTVTKPVTVLVEDHAGVGQSGVNVYAFDGTTYTGSSETTDGNGEAAFTLLEGSYRFRADFEGEQYWSGTENHCPLPGCEAVTVLVGPEPTPTATPMAAPTEQATPTPTLEATPTATPTPQDPPTPTPTEEATQASANGHIGLLAKLLSENLRLPQLQTGLVVVSVADTDGLPQESLSVYAFDGDTYTGHHGVTDASGEVVLELPDGDYRFRADRSGTQFWSGDVNHCTVPACTAAVVTVTKPVTITVADTDGLAQEGLKVYAFDGVTYTGHHGTSDAHGQVSMVLPTGDYRFRADLNGTQFWSGEGNHCMLPGCEAAAIVVTKPVTVRVEDTDGVVKEGVSVYAFDGSSYTGFKGTTDSNGEVELTLPQEDYRFRADFNGTQFWSADSNHCTIPGCESASVVVTKPVTVAVQDTDAAPAESLKVYAFDGSQYTGFNGTTDASGAVTFTLPQGEYRFRADLNGTHFWSGEVNHCSIPGCERAGVTVTKPVLVTVASELGDPYADLPVYVFDGGTYTGFSGTSDTNGQVSFTLPVGDYRFRADFDGVQFWSNSLNHCTVPGCEAAAVEIPGGFGSTTTTIDYAYDPLYRLTSADYSSGEFFHYAYDAVGNRLTEQTHEELNSYTYDIANRLTSVNAVNYIWDDKGNLLGDGISIYSYDHANRLAALMQGSDSYSFEYNGLGDRLQQSVNSDPTGYTLDINRGLTQVIGDGTNSYLYGIARVGEQQPAGMQYHLGDALGSVRQLLSPSAAVTATRSYEPFGTLLSIMGTASSEYGFAAEWEDRTGLVHLRARYLDTAQGRFLTKDPWGGGPRLPQTMNPWSFVVNNPMRFADPSGMILEEENSRALELVQQLQAVYGIRVKRDWGYTTGDSRQPSWLPPELNGIASCAWHPGKWDSLRELRLLLGAAFDFSKEVGGPSGFRRIMGGNPVTVSRWDAWGKYGGFAPHRLLAPATGDAILVDYTFYKSQAEGSPLRESTYTKFLIVHELAHVWDFRQSTELSQGMGLATGRLRYCTTYFCIDDPENPSAEFPPGDYAAKSTIEDWAQSFAGYIYPTEISRYWSSGLGPRRIQYIEDVLARERNGNK